jgi:hypothetical protein
MLGTEPNPQAPAAQRKENNRMSRRSPDFALNAVRGFTGTLMWAPDDYLDALTLILAVSHAKDAFDSVPYVLATSKEPKVGKSTLTKDIPLLLASRPWRVSRNTTTDALRNRFLDREPPDVLLLDDASKIFAESGTRGTTSPLYQLAVDGYVKNATVSVSRNGQALDLPAYVMLFMNGLRNAVPNDLATRAIQFKLSPKPPEIRMRSALSAATAKEAGPLKEELHRWAASHKKEMQDFLLSDVNRVHPKLTDRLMQIWGPLFAVAHVAGGTWPRRCLEAFLSMGLDEGEKPVVQRDEQALLDTAKIIMDAGADRIFTANLVPALRALPSDFYREVDDHYLVEDLLPRALGPSQEMRGRALDGRRVTGVGRLAGPILVAAADLRDELYPAPADRGPDRVQRELQLTEA